MVGFIPRPIPMKPRFDGFYTQTHTHETQIWEFHGYEKIGFGYGSYIHTQNSDPFFFEFECMVGGLKKRSSEPVAYVNF